MNTPKRYHPIMVILHWLTVILLVGAGLLADSEGGGSPIDTHIIIGVLLLVIMILRLIVRFTTKRPEWANTDNPFLNKLGEWVHIGLYFLAFSILIFGGLIASKRNLLGYALGTGSIIHVRYGLVGELHQLSWMLIVGLLLLHIGGALYHQFIIKDNLFGRMWFGK